MVERAGIQFGARYRTVEEHAIVEMLLLAGFAFEVEFIPGAHHGHWRLEPMDKTTVFWCRPGPREIDDSIRWKS